ncbi:DNA repair exonuclease [Bacillus carboniphilus]|uniref:DNA repair exonuclease n=1 Tax=Bacillus carboniphilus TaxID=86663 RepID=A0ABP3FZD6_9BACI
MKEVSFIHTADLHLDSPFVGLKNLPSALYERMKESTFSAFRNLVQYAIEKRVDFILISGDLYDGEDRSIRAQLRFKREMEKLHNANIRVFVIHGNHDFLNGSWTQIKMPDNVHIFKPEPEAVEFNLENGTHVSVAGFSYAKRHEMDHKLSQFPTIKADLKIGMLHGHDGTATDHLAYAPFRISDLLTLSYDYWALGHIHTRKVLHEEPYIIYPGNIQGRHVNERGEKGFYHVTWTPTNQEAHFVSCQDIEWRKETLIVSETNEPDELVQSWHQILNQIEQETDRAFVRLELEYKGEPFASTKQFIESGHFLEVLQEEDILDEESFVWVNEVRVNEVPSEKGLTDHPFLTCLKEVMEQEHLPNELDTLLHHKKASRFLQEIPQLELEEIKKEAMKVLLQSLHS